MYADFLFNQTRLLPLARQRAQLPDWSKGGWPGAVGSEVSGMSCGPTVDWDHDYGCASGFGGFDGLAFVSCAGPFRGMECCFDDGTRFVAGLTATPLLSYFDGTQDAPFLEDVLAPYLREVASFYTSYAVAAAAAAAASGTGTGTGTGTADRRYDLPWTCAQETCNSGATARNGSKAAEHNNHQDLAYARMAYQRLLQFTDPAGAHGIPATAQERATWARMLAGLAAFPLTADAATPSDRVFAQSAAAPGDRPAPVDSNAGGYCIVRLAAIHPAGLVDAYSNHSGGGGQDPDGPPILAVARATTQLVNEASDFAPGNGFCLSWPSSAAVEDRQSAASGALLANFSAAYARKATPNGWPDLGGGGLEQVGAVVAIQMLLVRVVDGVLRLFPGWPASSRASFTDLRVTGAFVVSATAGARSVSIISEAGLPLLLPGDLFDSGAKETGGTGLCRSGGHRLPQQPNGLYALAMEVGDRVVVTECASMK